MLPPIKKLRARKQAVLEKDIERKVCEYARSRSFLVYKFVSPQIIGVPDRIFISPAGVLTFIEFKRPGETTRSSQDREIARLRKHNQRVYIIDDVEQGKAIVDAITF